MRILVPMLICLALVCSCAGYARSVTDIELPWKVIASTGNDRLVEFVIRPYFEVKSVYLAGGFNDWTYPGGQGRGRVYPMEYDSARDYWVCLVLLPVGAWEYVYVAEDGFAFGDGAAPEDVDGDIASLRDIATDDGGAEGGGELGHAVAELFDLCHGVVGA